jgi:hypothetical protein
MKSKPGTLQALVFKSLVGLSLLLTALLTAPVQTQAAALNSNPPSTPVRLIFIHHSVGENWLNPDLESGGALLTALNSNWYFVSDTYYDWEPMDPDLGNYIGSHTDIGNWFNWFLGPYHDNNLAALYTQTGIFTNSSWLNAIPNPGPGGQNQIILFKSCFPNSAVLSGNPGDPPRLSSSINPNPIWGKSTGEVTSEQDLYSVSNVKGMYRDLLGYFATRQDKLFILITPPPVHPDNESIAGSSDRARAINTWLIHHWLDNYPYHNVAVFDFFNVLTSNGGDVYTHDLEAAGGNHHRLVNGQVQHVIQVNNNYSAYPSGDSHPTAAGSQKATGEFVPLLNVAFHAWQGTGARPWFMGRSPSSLAGAKLLLLE